MRILIVSFTFPPQVGGVAEVARTQVVELLARGYQVSVATGFDSRRTRSDAPPGVNVRQFNITGGFQLGNPYRGQTVEYQDFIARADVDIVLFHCWQNFATDLAVPVLSRCRARKVLLSHGFDAHIWKRYPRFAWGLGAWLRNVPYYWKLPRSMRAFDRLVFLSERCDTGRFVDVAVARKTCPDRISIIPNGVHLAEFAKESPDFRKQFGIDQGSLVLNVANYDDRKNQIASLQDFMTANRPDATLVFIGGEFNDYHAHLKQAYSELSRSFSNAKVRFLEKVPKPMIYAAYKAADIFVLGAKQETQPLAILDAMAAGVPFISTNAGCVSEFPGGLVRSAGAETTAALNQLLDHPEQRRQLGEAGRKACQEKYDWARVMDAYDALFRKLVVTPR